MERDSALDALLGPLEDRLHAPPRTGPGRSHLPLPAVEAAGFVSGTHTRGDRFARILGPQPPRPWLKGIAHDGGQLGLALGIGRETCQNGRGEGAQALVVVPERELVQGPGPVGARGGVPAQQFQGVPPTVGGEVAEDGQGQPRA